MGQPHYIATHTVIDETALRHPRGYPGLRAASGASLFPSRRAPMIPAAGGIGPGPGDVYLVFLTVGFPGFDGYEAIAYQCEPSI